MENIGPKTSSAHGGGGSKARPPSTSPIQGKPKIAIIGQDLGGMGDYASVDRIQQFFHKTFSKKIPRENMQVFMDNDKGRDLDSYFPGVEFHPLKNIGKFEPDMIVAFEGDFLKERVLPEHLGKRVVPILDWGEYGVTHGEGAINTGLIADGSIVPGCSDRPPEKGIFLDKELVKWSSKMKDPKQRLSALPEVSAGIQQAILGGKATERRCNDFSSENRLFFGYSNEEGIKERGGDGAPSAITYLLALAKMQGSMPRASTNAELQKKNMTIFLMGDHDILAEAGDQSKYLGNTAIGGAECTHSSLLQVEVQRELVSSGIFMLEVARYDKSSDQIVAVKFLPIREMNPHARVRDSSNLKTMRVIMGSISHKDSIGLMKASEDEVLVTGDGSLSEAISARKSIMYQQRHHKYHLSLGLKSRFPQLHSHLEGTDTAFEPGRHPGDIFYDKRVNKKEHLRESDRVIKTCDLEKNIASKVKGIVKEILQKPR
ncbi:MAG: hypothetical protein SP1CHLAM9_02410 [Chlamydiia bacterium]|nr:hypothetical protein [Chlamydiia bacterium]MCH9624453.1 hypothetical protein [Chlamydiia bacterium]